MAASVKVKTEDLEQVALAMMMMAGGEGTSAAEVGVKTRSSSSRRSSTTQSQQSNRRGREPVSGNNPRVKATSKNHDQAEPTSIDQDEEECENTNDNEDEDPHDPDQSQSATDLVLIKKEEPDEAIICAINPLSIQSVVSPGSPAGSLQSTNSGSGASLGGGGNGNLGSNQDCIYMSTSRRIFRPEFKQKVLDAFASDPDCIGNQRATARKFGIHRRQVQKWLQQLSTGELSLSKDLQLQQQADQGDGEEPFSEQGGLTSSNLIIQRSSFGNGGRSSNGKFVTRRSLGSSNIRRSTVQGQRSIVRRDSEPSSRPVKGLVRNRGGKNVNGKSATATSASSADYYNESNGSGNEMFMNMSTLLASAAAAGNLNMPLSLDNPRNFSPRDHSPINGRLSPTHSAGGSSGGSNNSNLQNALLLVDELNFLYPYSDFSLLRKALLKEEVSLEKLAHPLIRGNKSTEFRVNGNGLNSDLTQGLRELRRAAALSPSPAKSSSSREEYNTQQTLDILRQQQEYLKLLQQCGIGNSGDLSGLNLAELANNGNGRLPSWFNPFAAAAAAGVSVPSRGNGNGENGRRNNKQEDNHRFASPRVPPANSNKAKTVAAALAASRVQSASSQQMRNYNQQNGRVSQNPRNPQRRKPGTNGRPPQQSSRGGHSMDDEMMIDPTSMLEVVTSIPSPADSPAARGKQYSQNGRTNGGDYQQGIDLSTTSASTGTSSNTTTTSSGPTRLISKAMNKEYSFLSELGLVRKSPEKENVVSTTSNNGKNGFEMTHTASLENFVQNILPRQKSPQAASSSTSSNSPPASDLTDSERTKSLVIDAFTYDPEISGDARAVARKFGLNVRVVMKWLKEAPSKSSPQANENGMDESERAHVRINGGGVSEDEENGEYLQGMNLQKALLNESNNNSTGSNGGVNKRKNSKPNQICDFATEDEVALNGALDMVVPIKKRRVSSPSPTPQDA